MPDYVEVDTHKLTAKFVRTPGTSDVPYPVQMETRPRHWGILREELVNPAHSRKTEGRTHGRSLLLGSARARAPMSFTRLPQCRDFSGAVVRPLAEICAILNSGYEGYVVPVRFDEAALMRRVLAEHIDLSASGLLSAGKTDPAGILLVARRGRISRIAALGLRPDWRGAGLGGRAVRWAIDTARARGDSALILESDRGQRSGGGHLSQSGVHRSAAAVGLFPPGGD